MDCLQYNGTFFSFNNNLEKTKKLKIKIDDTFHQICIDDKMYAKIISSNDILTLVKTPLDIDLSSRIFNLEFKDGEKTVSKRASEEFCKYLKKNPKLISSFYETDKVIVNYSVCDIINKLSLNTSHHREIDYNALYTGEPNLINKTSNEQMIIEHDNNLEPMFMDSPNNNSSLSNVISVGFETQHNHEYFTELTRENMSIYDTDTPISNILSDNTLFGKQIFVEDLISNTNINDMSVMDNMSYTDILEEELQIPPITTTNDKNDPLIDLKKSSIDIDKDRKQCEKSTPKKEEDGFFIEKKASHHNSYKNSRKNVKRKRNITEKTKRHASKTVPLEYRKKKNSAAYESCARRFTRIY